MRASTCVLLFAIFAFTSSIPQSRRHKELVLRYNTEKRSRDTKRQDEQVVGASGARGGARGGAERVQLVFRARAADTLADFLQETVDVLNVFPHAAFQDFFYILNKEIRNYHYKGCKVAELTANVDTNNFLMQAFRTIRGKPVAFIKATINAAADKLRDQAYDSSVAELLDHINSLYTDAKQKFHKVLNNLNHYRKTKLTHNELVQVVRHGVRTVFFNHYSELDSHTRRELNERIKRFWEKFKSSPASGDINDIDAKLARERVELNLDISKLVKNLKKDSKTNLENKRERVVSMETYDGHYQGKDVEGEERSVGSGETESHYNEELSSRQSFDSSSNSIQLSQERQEEYNTQRYVTLYTEEMVYKARTTKVTKSTGRHKRPATTPRYKKMLSDRTSKVEVLRMNRGMYDKPRVPAGAGGAGGGRQRAHLYSQYDAVINVRLANTALLKSLSKFAPGAAREPEQNEKSWNQRYAVKRRAKSLVKPQNSTAPTKPPSRHSISYESHYKEPALEIKRGIAPSSANIAPVDQHMESNNTKNNSSTGPFDNDTKVSDEYIVKRISVLETELKDLKQIRDIRSKADKNNKKDMTEHKVERLSNTHQDLKLQDVNKENDNTKSYATNNETTTNDNMSSKPNTISNDAVKAIDMDNTTAPQVTNIAADTTNTGATDLNKAVTAVTVTATDSTVDVTDTAAVGAVTAAPREAMAYSTPAYYDYPDRRIDPFEHFNDGLDLNM